MDYIHDVCMCTRMHVGGVGVYMYSILYQRIIQYKPTSFQMKATKETLTNKLKTRVVHVKSSFSNNEMLKTFVFTCLIKASVCHSISYFQG